MIEFLKKNKTVSFLFLIGVICLTIGITYAFFNINFSGAKNNQLVIGQDLIFRYDETGDALNLTSDDILSDAEGKTSSKYFDFEVTQTTDTKQKTLYYIYLTKDSNSTLSDGRVKVYLTNQSNGMLVNTTQISKLQEHSIYENSYYLYETSITTNNSTVTNKYRLRVWIQEDTSTTITEEDGVHTLTGEEELTYKFTINIETGFIPVLCDKIPEEESNANVPELASNMIPVCYNSEKDIWVKADSTNTSKTHQWYSYSGKTWANAVTVAEADGTRDDIVDAPAGKPIPMERINTMLVWIPRFSATKNGDYNGATEFVCSNTTITNKAECIAKDYVWMALNPGAFNITFVNKETTAHDAFTFGSETLSGFWMGKFENSSNETCEPVGGQRVGFGCNLLSIRPKVLPNASMWRGADVSTFFYDMQKMTDSGNQYGFDKTVDTHMTKNNEWGAVTYLTQSIYGRCTDLKNCLELGVNNNSNFITGYGAPAGSDYEENDDEYPYIAPQAYNTIQGMDASTTGNIYGIYDMSGGSHEYLMGVNPASTSGDMSGFSSSYNNSTLDKLPNSKYYNMYSTNTAYTNSGLQHAVIETRGWYNSIENLFSFSSIKWIYRGGIYNEPSFVGMFTVQSSSGGGISDGNSRLSVTIN